MGWQDCYQDQGGCRARLLAAGSQRALSAHCTPLPLASPFAVGLLSLATLPDQRPAIPVAVAVVAMPRQCALRSRRGSLLPQPRSSARLHALLPPLHGCAAADAQMPGPTWTYLDLDLAESALPAGRA